MWPLDSKKRFRKDVARHRSRVRRDVSQREISGLFSVNMLVPQIENTRLHGVIVIQTVREVAIAIRAKAIISSLMAKAF